MKPIAFIKTGRTLAEINLKHGDFDDWFQSSMQLKKAAIRVFQVDEGDDPGPVEKYAGILVTGSPAMVTDHEPWSLQAGHWLQGAIHAKIPVLGVCYGHQLLAQTLGGDVGPNPNGREMGSQKLDLNVHADDDLLTQGLPTQLIVQKTHLQSVLVPPPNAVVLGGYDADPYAFLRFSEKAWGMQFHPEFTTSIMRAYISSRSQDINDEGGNAADLISRISKSPSGEALLQRFVHLCQHP